MKVEQCNKILGDRYLLLRDNYERKVFIHLGEQCKYALDITGSKYLPKSGLLLCQYIAKLANGKDVLDVGTGYNALLANHAFFYGARNVDAVDIDQEAIIYAKNQFKKSKINFYCGDKFEAVPKKKYDLIVSNPPQLPLLFNDDGYHDFAGIYGREIIDELIIKSQNALKSNGKILLLVFKFLGIEEMTSDDVISLKELSEQYGFNLKVLKTFTLPIRNGGMLDMAYDKIAELYPHYKFIENKSGRFNEICIVELEK